MKTFSTVAEIRKYLVSEQLKAKSIGLVPTMGALHHGHISLIEASKAENDITVVTIFVNPAQFNNVQDLRKYPRTPEQDLEMLEDSGTEVVFIPPVEEMYEPDEDLTINPGQIVSSMEGHFRPGHFDGVALVVSKLFNIITPDRAYFGQKDLQQFKVIEQLNKQLKFGIGLRMIPIVRDPHGLALSSRNRLLSAEGKEIATHLFKLLTTAGELLSEGWSIAEVKKIIKDRAGSIDELDLEYFEIVSEKNLSKPQPGDEDLALCIAGYVKGIRLIDNTLLTLRRN